MPIRVLLAEADPGRRAGIRSQLAQDPVIQVVAETGDGQEALDLAIAFLPDVVLLAGALPRLDALTVLRLLRRAHPIIRVILLIDASAAETLSAAEEAGASACILRPSHEVGLEVVVRAVHGGLVPPPRRRR